MAKPTRATTALDRAVVAALEELVDLDFATGPMLAMRRRFAEVPTSALTKSLFKALSGWGSAAEPANADEVRAFAAWLVLMVGIGPASKGLEAHFDGSLEHVLLGELLGLSMADRIDLPAAREFVSLQVPALRQLLTADAAGPVALNQALLELPAVLRTLQLEALFHGAKPSKAMRTFAALALLFPFDSASKKQAMEWLTAHGGPEGAHFLATLPASAVEAETLALVRRALKRLGPANDTGAKGLPGIPVTWPVVEAFATPGDGQGSQGLYLLRRMSPRRFALVGVVCSDQRGIAAGIQIPEAPATEIQAMLDEMTGGGAAVAAMPVSYIVQRIRAGVALAGARHLPLPHDFQTARYLLAGLDDDGAPDVLALVRQWADATTLPDTHYLLHTSAGASWYYGIEDGPGEAFFEAASTALDRITIRQGSLKVPAAIVQEADEPDGQLLWLQRKDSFADLIGPEATRLFTPDERERWYRRLAHMAYWFDCADQPTMRDLAATAAVAMAPDSGVPLDKQPLIAGMLRLSVLRLEEH